MPSIKSQMRHVGVPTKVSVPSPVKNNKGRIAIVAFALALFLAPLGGPFADTSWGRGPGVAAVDNTFNHSENTREAYDALDQHLPESVEPLEFNVPTPFVFWDPPDDFVSPHGNSGASISFDGNFGAPDIYGGIRRLAGISYHSNRIDDSLAPGQCESIPINLNEGDSLRAVNTDLDVRDEPELVIELTDDDSLKICNGNDENPAQDEYLDGEDLDNLYIEVVESAS